MKCLAQGHIARKWQSQDFKPLTHAIWLQSPNNSRLTPQVPRDRQTMLIIRADFYGHFTVIPVLDRNVHGPCPAKGAKCATWGKAPAAPAVPEHRPRHLLSSGP